MIHWLREGIVRNAWVPCLAAWALVAPGAGLACAQEVLSLPLDRAPVRLSFGGDFAAGPGLSSGAALWAPGSGWEELGGPGGPGIAVSDDGNVVLAAGPNGGATGGEIWVRGIGWAPLGFPGPQRAMALSSDGRHVVAVAVGSGDVPYVWDRQSGTFTRLDVPQGALAVDVAAVSLGAILSVGTAEFQGGTTRAVAWDAAGAATFIAPPGSRAGAVSDNGEWAAGSSASGAERLAFRWNRSTGRIQLPPVGSAPQALEAYGARKVSDDGALVIGNRQLPGSPPEGIAWTPTFGTRLLTDYLQFEGLGSLGSFTQVVAASADGRRFLVVDGSQSIAPRFLNVDALVSFDFCTPAVPNSTGQPVGLVLLGATTPSRNALYLRATGIPPGAFVQPLVSMDAALVPMAGGSAGTLCLGGAIGRYGPRPADASGTIFMRVDLDRLPSPSGTAPVLQGQTWRFQCWYRDPGAAGSNFTAGALVLLS